MLSPQVIDVWLALSCHVSHWDLRFLGPVFRCLLAWGRVWADVGRERLQNAELWVMMPGPLIQLCRTRNCRVAGVGLQAGDRWKRELASSGTAGG